MADHPLKPDRDKQRATRTRAPAKQKPPVFVIQKHRASPSRARSATRSPRSD